MNRTHHLPEILLDWQIPVSNWTLLEKLRLPVPDKFRSWQNSFLNCFLFCTLFCRAVKQETTTFVVTDGSPDLLNYSCTLSVEFPIQYYITLKNKTNGTYHKVPWRASKRQGTYSLLFTDTEVNNCVTIYQTSE